MARKVLISVSGGMDSATLLGLAKMNGYQVLPMHFRYGSKHMEYETLAAKRLCEFYHVPYGALDINGIFNSASALLASNPEPIPEGHYEAQTMRKTVVPGRNIVFTSILASLAAGFDLNEIWIGVHAGDHAIYPDCRPAFIDPMKQAIFAGTDGQVHLSAPFLHCTKTDILHNGHNQIPPVPYELTRTCYTSDEIACGKCGSCQERLEAFFKIGKEDPIKYTSRELLPVS